MKKQNQPSRYKEILANAFSLALRQDDRIRRSDGVISLSSSRKRSLSEDSDFDINSFLESQAGKMPTIFEEPERKVMMPGILIDLENDQLMFDLAASGTAISESRGINQVVEIRKSIEIIPLEPYVFDPSKVRPDRISQDLEEHLLELSALRASRFELDDDDFSLDGGQLNQEVEQLKDENENLNDENSTWREEIEKLKQEKLKLASENAKLIEKILFLEELILQLKSELENVRCSGGKSSDQQELERLVRELYYRKGYSHRHRDMWNAENTEEVLEILISEIQERIKNVLTEFRGSLRIQNLKQEKAEDGKEGPDRPVVDEIQNWGQQLARLKKDWIKQIQSLNKLSDQKKRLDKDLEVWRKKLVKIADNSKEFRKEKQNLQKYVKEVESIIEKEKYLTKSLTHHKPAKTEARMKLEKEIITINRFLDHTEMHEISKLRREIEQQQVLEKVFRDRDPPEAYLVGLVKLMIQHFDELFFGLSTKSQKKDVHHLVGECVRYLREHDHVPHLFSKVVSNQFVVNQIKWYAYRGFGVDLNPVQEPDIVGAVLKDYFAELEEPLTTYKLYPAFREVGRMVQTTRYHSMLKRVKETIKQLTTLRRATLCVLIEFLREYCVQEVDRDKAQEEVSRSFAPVLFRPNSNN